MRNEIRLAFVTRGERLNGTREIPPTKAASGLHFLQLGQIKPMKWGTAAACVM